MPDQNIQKFNPRQNNYRGRRFDANRNNYYKNYSETDRNYNGYRGNFDKRNDNNSFRKNRYNGDTDYRDNREQNWPDNQVNFRNNNEPQTYNRSTPIEIK